MDNLPPTEGDSGRDDVYVYRHKRRVGPATFCRDSARYRVPYAPDRRPFAPRQRSNFQDCDPAPAYRPVSTGTPYAAKPMTEIYSFFR